MERKPHLEYLQARTELMEKIEGIVESELDGIVSQELSDELVKRLCDAVCKHFPTQAQDSIQSAWVPKSLPLDS